MGLKINPERFGNQELDDVTGIFIRAFHPDGKWENVDLCQLDRKSIIEWTNSRKNGALNALLFILGYEQVVD
jgi:hypothetical protein